MPPSLSRGLGGFLRPSFVQLGEQILMQPYQQRDLNTEEQALLDAPPPSHRITLDGHCALAAARGQVVLYDIEGTGLRHVDLADLDPRGWTT
jgi:hypothetical protein